MSKKLSRNPSDVFARIGLTTRKVRRNLRQTYSLATDSQILEGLLWYEEAHSFAVNLSNATGVDLVVVCAVIAALSPQTRWQANKAAAVEFLKNDTRLPGMLVSNFERAKRVRDAGPMNALATLQIKGDESAPKIAAFARNILGDESRVTIDVWAVRAALGDVPNPEQLLSRVGVYNAIAEQYAKLAAEQGISAPQYQAIAWTVTRGKAD